MADRYDPKLSLRSIGDRKAAEPRHGGPVQDDPLAELAKIVSGRSTGSSRAQSSRSAAAAPTSASGDTLGDLETELLNDLQASFAAVREMVPTPPAGPSPSPVHSDPLPPPHPEPESYETTLHPAIEPPLPPASMAERLAPQAPVTPFEFSTSGRIAEPRPPEARRMPPDADERPRTEPAPPSVAPPLAAPPSRSTGLASDFGSFRQRLSEAQTPEAPPPTVRPARSRWERAEPDKPATPVSRFAPPRPSAAVPPRAPLPDEEIDPYGDLVSAEDDEAPEEFPLDGFGDLDPEEDETGEPTFPQGDLASLMEPRRSRTPILVAGVVGLVLVGGIAVAMFRPTSTESGTPPVIVADGAPTRITPEATVADTEAQSKLIYDRVNPGEETTVLAPGEEAIAAIPSDDSASNPITRVIIPGGPGFDDPSVDAGLSLEGQPSTMPTDDALELAANESGDGLEGIGPRRVRTVVVKPDGTIVESGASEAGQPAAAPVDAAVAPAADPEPAPIVEPPAPAPVTDDMAAISGTSGSELAITPVPEIGGAATAVLEEPLALPTPAPAQPVPASPPPQPAVAAVQPATPADPSPAPPAGGMLVQVSSQRSEDAARATFRDLQARYPGILGPYDVNIQRAEIPDRGTFFRVRVGPFSASDAQRLCNDLKSAGGDCILAQR